MPLRRLGKGSMATSISHGLAGPKAEPTGICRKGNGLIIPCRGGDSFAATRALLPTPPDTASGTAVPFNRRRPGSGVMPRTG